MARASATASRLPQYTSRLWGSPASMMPSVRRLGQPVTDPPGKADSSRSRQVWSGRSVPVTSEYICTRPLAAPPTRKVAQCRATATLPWAQSAEMSLRTRSTIMDSSARSLGVAASRPGRPGCQAGCGVPGPKARVPLMGCESTRAGPPPGASTRRNRSGEAETTWRPPTRNSPWKGAGRVRHRCSDRAAGSSPGACRPKRVDRLHW